MSTLPPYLPSRFLSWKLKKPQPGPSFLGKVLVQQQCFRYYVCVCVRLDQGENRQIVKLKPPPSFLVYGTARAGN